MDEEAPEARVTRGRRRKGGACPQAAEERALTPPPAGPGAPLSPNGRGEGVAAGSLPVGGAGWRGRHDGFTAERRRAFLEVLAKTGCVSDGARVAGVSTTTVDRWRRQDAVFAKACETALHMAASHIETLAWERGVTGIEEPVWHHGKRVGTRLKRSDAIFRLLLIASNRKKYGRLGAVGRKALVKAERKRIEREIRAGIAAERPDAEEVRRSILLRLMRIDAHERGGPPPHSVDDPDHLAWEAAEARRREEELALFDQWKAERGLPPTMLVARDLPPEG